jgi:hypothetical protein
MDGVGSFAGSNTGMGYSGTIWGDCPVEELRGKQATGPQGFLWEKIFTSIPITPPTTEGNWGDMAAFSDTGGTMTADTTEIGGGVAIGSDGDNEGASMRTVVVPAKIILTGGDFWFEARILTSTITDAKHNIFLGLMENVALTATVPITAAGALADKNLIGFQRPESARTTAGTGGAIMNAVYKADGQTAVNAQTDAVTLVAATYTNLGMKFIPKRNIGKGAGYFLWFQDGVQVASYLVTTTAGNPFPNDINLGFVFAVLNATASSPGTSTIKHVRMAQLLNPLG